MVPQLPLQSLILSLAHFSFAIMPVLADVTNAAAPIMPTAEPIKSTISMQSMLDDIDRLVAEKDEEVEAPLAVAVAPQMTTVVPSAPQLECAEIDPAITALKVVRQPIPAFIPAPAQLNGYETDEEDIIPSSRRIQFVYAEDGELIGTQDAAPLPPCFHADPECDEDGDDDDDDYYYGESVLRMTSEEDFVVPAPLTLDHAAPIARRAVANSSVYTSGFLPSGILSASAVRSVKLDADEPIQEFLFVQPTSTQANVAKVTGFVGAIDVNRVQSKKL